MQTTSITYQNNRFGQYLTSKNSVQKVRTNYIYAFQGQERDDEIKGRGNSYNYTFRMHDSRLGRFFAIDPLAGKYPYYTPYSFSGNEVISASELEGLEPVQRVFSNGFLTSEPKLKSQSEWYVNTYVNSSGYGASTYSSTDWKSFDKANTYNTEQQNANAYKSISDRHEYYGWVSTKLSASNGKYWFQAAKIVTAWNGVGSAESLNMHYLNDDAEHFLKAGNRTLMYANMFNAKMLIKNGELQRSFVDAKGNEQSFKGLSGLSLDLKLVEYEQTKVQNFIGEYTANNPAKDMKAIIKSVNKAFSSAPLQNGLMKGILKENFYDKGIKFDFSNYDHRVTLGQELVKKLRDNDKK